MISDSELQLLELYLDDALSADEVGALDQRLWTDPRMTAALGVLRAQRLARSTVWRVMERETEMARSSSLRR